MVAGVPELKKSRFGFASNSIRHFRVPKRLCQNLRGPLSKQVENHCSSNFFSYCSIAHINSIIVPTVNPLVTDAQSRTYELEQWFSTFLSPSLVRMFFYPGKYLFCRKLSRKCIFAEKYLIFVFSDRFLVSLMI
jgi:hypothetical protein